MIFSIIVCLFFIFIAMYEDKSSYIKRDAIVAVFVIILGLSCYQLGQERTQEHIARDVPVADLPEIGKMHFSTVVDIVYEDGRIISAEPRKGSTDISNLITYQKTQAQVKIASAKAELAQLERK